MEAYVDPQNYRGEIKSMMTYYNPMLADQPLYQTGRDEKKKKKLELEGPDRTGQSPFPL